MIGMGAKFRPRTTDKKTLDKKMVNKISLNSSIEGHHSKTPSQTCSAKWTRISHVLPHHASHLPVLSTPTALRRGSALPHLPSSDEPEDKVDLHFRAEEVLQRERGVGVSGHVF